MKSLIIFICLVILVLSFTFLSDDYVKPMLWAGLKGGVGTLGTMIILALVIIIFRGTIAIIKWLIPQHIKDKIRALPKPSYKVATIGHDTGRWYTSL